MQKKHTPVSRLTPNQISLVKLGRALLDAHIQLASRRGYIERIHEVENRPAPPQDGYVIPDSIKQLGRVIADTPEREASAILDALSPDLLDRVLGKPDTSRDVID
jgi:hypothetical protein